MLPTDVEDKIELTTRELSPGPQVVVAQAPTARLVELFGSFLGLGLTAFGGPAMVAYIRRMAVQKKRWLDADAFDSGVALCQAIPGATVMQTAAYVGLRVRGVAGAAASFVGFGLPAFVLMLVLSGLYARTHELPIVVSAFSGLRAIIVALVANATVTFGKSSLKRWPHVLLAALSAALLICETNPFLVIALAGLVAMVIVPASRTAPGALHVPTRQPMRHTTKPVFALLAAAAVIFLGLWTTQRRLFDLATLMSRIDLFAFGGGFSSVPLMCHEAVEVRHWLDKATLLDGIVLGQVTPGPIVITATFIGYLFAGLAGGVTATVAVFLPSFLILIATAPYFERMRTSRLFNKIIAGLLCSFVGLLLVVTARFAEGVPWDSVHLLLGVGSFVALRLKVNVAWVVAIGAGLSIALCR
jgi:chromate transporter